MNITSKMLENRESMKCPVFADGMAHSDQELKLPQPPVEKAATGEKICLPLFEGVVKNDSYCKLLDLRRSQRHYTGETVTQEQLALLLWSTQGVQTLTSNRYATLRPVPSGGARHPFEVYIAVLNIEGLETGIYHYLPLENIGEKRVTIERIGDLADTSKTITEALVGQDWAADAAFVLFYTCIAYRGEWRYHEMSHRVMLIDLGHVGQNAMLSAEAVGLGSCCCAAFDNNVCDKLLGVDGKDEFTVYAIPIGAVKN